MQNLSSDSHCAEPDNRRRQPFVAFEFDLNRIDFFNATTACYKPSTCLCNMPRYIRRLPFKDTLREQIRGGIWYKVRH